MAVSKVFQRCWCYVIMIVSLSSAYNHRPPNVVFFMVDDMGWNDVSFHGSDQIQTPNIDALAYQGVILQQYYSEAICTPARTALLTGKYPMRLGMHGSPLFNSEDRGIPLTERLLPSYMKEMGYDTHLVGKWHVGMSKEEYLPTARGYDTHYGMRGGFIDYYTYNKVETWPDGRLMFGLDLFDNNIPQETEQRYIIDALTDRAIKVINRHNASSPLFLHITHNAPHAGNSGGALQPPLYGSVKNRHIANSDRRLYADVVTHVDRSLGKIVGALAEQNLLDDTIIIFISDNGAPTVGEFSNWGTNLPFRGRKETPWEGAVRVPAFVWHANIKPKVWNGLMHITDWLPTLIAAAGGELRGDIDGVNQWESITKNRDSNRKEVLVTIEDSATLAFAAYRAGDYKIVVGNVTGMLNDYYGAEFLINKYAPPDYFSNLKSCEVARVFSFWGKIMDYDEVMATRQATIIRQLDTVTDATPCTPTPNRGCLYNVRLDPAERHDLWERGSKIASILTSRLRGFWAQQLRRNATAIQIEADPANFGYIWTPWLDNLDLESDQINNRQSDDPEFDDNIETYSPINYNIGNSLSKNTTIAGVINCDGPTNFRNFLCLLRSAF